jgi:hypothetical protein
MTLIAERNAHPRVVNVMGAPEIPVADFQLTEEELATPLPGRIRRRAPGPPDGPPAPEGRPDRRPDRGSRQPAKGPAPDAAELPTPGEVDVTPDVEVPPESNEREPSDRPSRRPPRERGPQDRGPRRDGPRQGNPKRDDRHRDRPVEAAADSPPRMESPPSPSNDAPAPSEPPKATPPDEAFGDGL